MDASDRLDEVKELVLKMTVIAARLDQRNGESTRGVERGVQVLDAATRRLQGGAEQFAEAVIHAVAGKLEGAVVERSAAALDACNAQLRASAGRARWAAEAMAEQRKLLGAAQRALVWKGLAALLVGSVLAATGSGYLLWQARQATADPAVAADVRAALRSGALARCNGNQLCARTPSAQRGGKPMQGEYVIVR